MRQFKLFSRYLGVFAMALAFLGAMATLGGCNTTEGVGEDIEAAGDAISDTARDAKN